MSYHRWELFSLGSIPHEVLSILLGSLPKVPDPRQEEKARERQYSTHDDRLSDDDEDEETRRTSPLIQDHNTSQHEAADHVNKSVQGLTEEDEDSQHSWNVPDDEWEWSDEEPSSIVSNSKTSRPSSSVASSNAKHGSSLAVPNSKAQRASPAGLGLLDSSRLYQSARDAPGSSSSNISTPSSPASMSGQKSPLGNDSAATSPLIGTTDSHPLSVAQDLCISICDSGRYIACASKKMFAILQRQTHTSASQLPALNMDQGQSSPRPIHEWVLVGQGAGLDTPQDTITAILCLPLYVPRSNQSQIYVVIGYKSGMLRIFNESGHLVVLQQLHHTPVMSIKARIGAGKVPGEDEDEMTILHEGGKVVCIEGESLWVVLRLSSGSSRSVGESKSIQASQAPTFAYKKWSLQNQDLMVDVVSCGPARHRPTLSNGFSSSSSSSMYTSQATERFVSVGSKPMMAFYASSSSGRPLFSATSLATQMAARVTSAVFGFAKSIWGSSPSPRPGSPALGNVSGRASPDQKRLSGQGVQDGTTGPYGNIYSSALAPATEVPAVLWLSDSQRCIRHLSLAPAPPRGSYYHYPSKLAAMTDSLGRVLLVDLEECEIIRMWKGLRGARCGWIQEERLVKSASGADNTSDEATIKRHLVLYLVIYAPKRGTVEIYPARQGKRVGVLQVGLGWKICTTFTSPIGKPILLDRATGQSIINNPAVLDSFSSPSLLPATSQAGVAPLGLSQCLLIGPTGEVRRIGSRLANSSNAASPTLSRASSTPPPASATAESIAGRLQSLGVS
ncbi:Rab3 GTPase-activating protein regulatory subunit N-terminus-domain-containing protein [Gamsiella multidivaricata]|uniref:Rab3 GTPase-activating protein regulatory subunit N-terminus-domain-containing protein n=1 Tax=Gamsiella multidivaricata TaxID=101098 RepID=UPI002220D672|nr:Rab3 GTPase-activating protein regulatory subunit N-terminus-domain-containing protein [Gamsiella multidivaricata]KAI7818840.1 Rab3 GTPase-activating protein regulatory subunit N-terminus-domain-containing protein [Gamsiella multidivaricata]